MVKIFFITILLIASALRLLYIGVIPPSPDWDEAALGYNAYSIFKTGKDEYGKFLPVVLESFNDYKPALYMYLIIPFLPVFDVSLLSVRLPSAILGIVAVITTFFLIKELFGKQITIYNKQVKTDFFALLVMFLFAISPWHIQFSRIGFEANTALTFNLLMLLFFLKGLKKPSFFVLSVFFAACGIYAYQSAKVFTPLFLVMLIVIYRNVLIKINKRHIFSSIFILFLSILPMVYYVGTNPYALTRAKGVSVFYHDQTNFLRKTTQRLQIDKQNNDHLGLMFDNRRITFAKEVFSNYLVHFNPNWLFIIGDSSRHHAPFMGMLYIVEFPFILIGLYFLIFGKIDIKVKGVLLSQLLIAPIPASITFDVPSAVRTLNTLPVYQVLSALGIMFITGAVWNQRKKLRGIITYSVFSTMAILAVFNFIYYLNQYFAQYNYFFSSSWQYGYKETIEFIKPKLSLYDKIIVSNQTHLDQSYMFFLYYLKLDPRLYLSMGGTKSGEFKSDHEGILNITFRKIQWDKEQKDAKTLYIGRPQDFPDNAHVIKTIYFLNGEEAVKIVKPL